MLAHENSQPTARNQSVETLQLVSFRLGREEYGLPITKVQEIILPGPVTKLPQAPPEIQGLINLRNTVIPIVDLHVRFGLPEAEAAGDRRIVVVNVWGKTIGLLVDAVCEVLRIQEERIAPPSRAVGGPGRDYVAGLANLDGRLLIVLDLERVFAVDDALHAP